MESLRFRVGGLGFDVGVAGFLGLNAYIQDPGAEALARGLGFRNGVEYMP